MKTNKKISSHFWLLSYLYRSQFGLWNKFNPPSSLHLTSSLLPSSVEILFYIKKKNVIIIPLPEMKKILRKNQGFFLMFKKTHWRKILKIFKEKKEKITKILVMCNFFFLQKTRVSRINCHRSLTLQSTSKKSKMKNITQRFFQILKANLSTIYIQF